jgi:hypothetical protein
MDLQWLSSSIRLVFEQVRKVAKASNQLGQNIFPETGWLQP